MAIQTILTGSTPNDGQGDNLKVGAGKINANFTELDSKSDFPNITTDYILFDTTAETTSSLQGTLSWNADDFTLDLIQNGTTLQLGQEQQYNVLNSSDETITNGMAVMAIGTDGASGNIKAGPMDGSDPHGAKYFLGIATEEILNGENGKITTFGKVRGIDTSIYSEGDVLYIDPSLNGELTNVEPISPNMAMAVAFVVNSKINGAIFVRVNNLNKHEFVDLHGDSIISGSLTISGSLVLENPTVPTLSTDNGTQGEIRTDSDYIYVCTATNEWKRSPLTTW